jgi:nucleoside diphosphate kinase
MAGNRTFTMVKPDAVKAGHIKRGCLKRKFLAENAEKRRIKH